MFGALVELSRQVTDDVAADQTRPEMSYSKVKRWGGARDGKRNSD
jgi:hypothetical protein